VHLQIKPGLRTAWRGPDAVQIGLDPRRGALVEGLTPADRGLVEQLAEGLDEAVLPAPGPSGDRAHRLLALLRQAGVLVGRRAGRAALARLGPEAARLAPDAAVWGVVHPAAGDGWELLAARSGLSVHVVGTGRLAAALVETLAAAGIGAVTASRELPAAAPAGPPDLVVLVRAAAADSFTAERLLAADVPHLAVVVREAGLVVGPLVPAGGRPCLRCLDLHRTDRDPGWPRLLAQLPGRPTAADDGETASSRLGAGLAALQVLGYLDGLRLGGPAAPAPASVGATLEVDLPDGLVARRSWPVHPRCGCAWPAPGQPPPPYAGEGVPAGSRGRPQDAEATMTR
jgi:hypothetical protein